LLLLLAAAAKILAVKEGIALPISHVSPAAMPAHLLCFVSTASAAIVEVGFFQLACLEYLTIRKDYFQNKSKFIT
jgi:hypothetical protein